MKLLVIDDHPTFRAGMLALLAQVEAGTSVLEAVNGSDGLRIANESPDLDAVFVDLMMPGMDGMTTLQEIVRRFPQLPVLVLSSSEALSDVRHALALGALGYLPKSASPQTILSALRFVLAGNVYVPPFILQASLIPEERYAPKAEKVMSSAAHLTGRQLDVLSLVCEGLSNKDICRRLDLSEKTVKAHVSAIFRTLNVVNRMQAARRAEEIGLVQGAAAANH